MSEIYKTSFAIPIYQARLYLVIGDDFCESRNILPMSLQEEEEVGSCRGFCLGLHPDYAILLKPDSPIGTISHEVGHVARKLMNEIGFTITAENDEPLAYLEDWLMTKILDKIPDKPKFSTHLDVVGAEGCKAAAETVQKMPRK